MVPDFETKAGALHYVERGSGDPIVFVHGTLCDYTVWETQAEALSSEFRVIAYSRRYAHPNNRQGDVMDSTVQNNADDLNALVDGIGAGKVHLIGHSYGGFIAAYFALKHPDKLHSLILANAAVSTMLVREPTFSSVFSLLVRSPRVALSARRVLNATAAAVKAVEDGDSTAPRRLFLPALFNGRSDLPSKPAEFDSMVARNARTLRETTTSFPPVTKTEVKKIGIPTMVICGELSAPWDYKVSQELAESIPTAERAVVPGAGHFFLLERPADANSKMLGFIRKHAGTRKANSPARLVS